MLVGYACLPVNVRVLARPCIPVRVRVLAVCVRARAW